LPSLALTWFRATLTLVAAFPLESRAQTSDTGRLYTVGVPLGPADSVRKLLSMGQRALALSYSQNWAASNPTDGAAQHAVTLSALASRQVDLAVQAGELSILLAPGTAAHHVALGRAYFERASSGDTPATREAARQSRDAFQQAIVLDSLNIEAREYLFTFHLMAPASAGASRTTARRLATEMGRVNPVKGMWAELRLASTVGPDASIRAAVMKAMNLAGTSADSGGLVMATMATTAGSARYPTMRETLVQAIYARFSQDPRVKFQRARLWITQARQLSDAERLLQEYLAMPSLPARSPSKGTVQWWLGQGYEKQGRAKEALAAYQVCAAMTPPSAECIRDANRLSASGSR
jgi:tetratricopeptide (TPR) repeat protein